VDPLDPPDKMDNQETMEPQDNPVAQEWTHRHHNSQPTRHKLARLASPPRTELLDPQDLPVHRAHLDNLDKAHSEEERDPVDHPDHLDNPDSLDNPVNLDPMELPDKSPKAHPFKDLLAHQDVPDNPETPASQETQDSPETPEVQDSQETLVLQEAPVNPEAQDNQVPTETLVMEASATIAHLHAQPLDIKQQNIDQLDNTANIHNALQKVLTFGLWSLSFGNVYPACVKFVRESKF